MSKVFCNDGNRTLHWTSSVTSVDLSQCYDRVAALQALGVDKIIVGLMLSCLQTISFFLCCTGFGISKTPYSGTKEKPPFGLGQGHGASPPGLTAVSTLMINAYNNLGHGAQMRTVWTGAFFAMSAILYVDDPDAVQMAVMDWG